jgi:hypothetical protein
MASAALVAGERVQYDALEQNRKAIGHRFSTFLSSEYATDIFAAADLAKGSPHLDLISYKGFLQSLNESMPGELFISDQSRGKVTPLTIAAQIERNQPTIVFLDYITLMENEKDWQSIAKLSGEMATLAQRYEIPIICAAQINRSGEGIDPPKSSALSGSDAIGQDAAAVITMSRPSNSVMRLRLAKYRNDEDGQMWYCKFKPNTGCFDEISGDQAISQIQRDQEER